MVDDDVAPLTTTCWVLPIRKVTIHVAIYQDILSTLFLIMIGYDLMCTLYILVRY